MGTKLTLACDGCDAVITSERISKKFVSFSGRSHGLGVRQPPDIDAAIPAGWVWSDPYTSCTYCPTCWEEIENGKETVAGS